MCVCSTFLQEEDPFSAAGAVEDLLAVWWALDRTGMDPSSPAPSKWQQFWGAWRRDLAPLTSRRPLAVACMLRGGGRHSSRTRFLKWTREAVQELGLNPNSVIVGEVDEGIHLSSTSAYQQTMLQSRVIVTTGPTMWDGDYRTWEALVSGASVVTEPLWNPISEAVVDGKHVRWVYGFAPARDHFIETIHAALENVTESRRIATQGFWHTLSHHRPIHRIDSLLRAMQACKHAGISGCSWNG